MPPASRGRSRERLQVAACSSAQAGGHSRCPSPFFLSGRRRQSHKVDTRTRNYSSTNIDPAMGLSGICNMITNFLIPQPDHQRLKIPNRPALDQQEMASLELETECLQACSLPQPCREFGILWAKPASGMGTQWCFLTTQSQEDVDKLEQVQS